MKYVNKISACLFAFACVIFSLGIIQALLSLLVEFVRPGVTWNSVLILGVYVLVLFVLTHLSMAAVPCLWSGARIALDRRRFFKQCQVWGCIMFFLLFIVLVVL